MKKKQKKTKASVEIISVPNHLLSASLSHSEQMFLDRKSLASLRNPFPFALHSLVPDQ